MPIKCCPLLEIIVCWDITCAHFCAMNHKEFPEHNDPPIGISMNVVLLEVVNRWQTSKKMNCVSKGVMLLTVVVYGVVA